MMPTFSRHATLAIPKSWQVENWKEVCGSDGGFSSKDGWLAIELPQAASVLLETSH